MTAWDCIKWLRLKKVNFSKGTWTCSKEESCTRRICYLSISEETRLKLGIRAHFVHQKTETFFLPCQRKGFGDWWRKGLWAWVLRRCSCLTYKENQGYIRLMDCITTQSGLEGEISVGKTRLSTIMMLKMMRNLPLEKRLVLLRSQNHQFLVESLF